MQQEVRQNAAATVDYRPQFEEQRQQLHQLATSVANLQATAPMVEGHLIADMIATLAMLDPVLGGVDR